MSSQGFDSDLPNSSGNENSVVVVLASRSPARLTILQNAGIDPLVRVSTVDEDGVLEHLSSSVPSEMVCALAEAKALDVASTFLADLESTDSLSGATPSRFLIIGCDSMLEIGGRMVGKPGTAEIAVERIREMRGKDATLWTGHSIVMINRVENGSDEPSPQWFAHPPVTAPASTVVHFGQISDEEIDAYVATGEPLNVAGSFTIDGFGGPFVEGVSGDPHAVVGLSLPLMRRLVKQVNISWPHLWRTRPPLTSATSR